VFFDTLCISFFLCYFQFLVFEAAIYANKDVYIYMQYHLTACVTSGLDSYPPVASSLITMAKDSEEAEGLHAHDNARVKSIRWSDLPIQRGV